LEIDKPEDKDDYNYLFWYLHHKNIGIYIGWDNKWYLEFLTKCKKLNYQGNCKIYENRPKICQDYNQKDCTKYNSEPAEKIYFKTVEDLENYLQKKKIKI
jgi:Fe-S-cluster containining protein